MHNFIRNRQAGKTTLENSLCYHQQCARVPVAPSSYQHLVFSCSYILAILVKCEVLVCTSLMPTDVKHLFVCLLYYKYYLQVCDLPFNFLSVLPKIKVFNFNEVHFSIFQGSCFLCIVKKSLPIPRFQRFSSYMFNIKGYDPFQVNFVQGKK